MRARLARVDAVIVQAVIAASLTFAHLHDVADAAGQHGWKAWAYPVSVDLLLVAAWRRLRSGTGRAAAWCWFVIALAASLGANVATAGLLAAASVPAWLRILVAGWPALAFLGGTLLAHIPAPVSQPIPNAPASAEPVTEAEPVKPAVAVPAPWSPTPARSQPTTSPVRARPSTHRPSAPASASPRRSPKPSPPSSERRTSPVPANRRFRNVIRIGPVQVGTANDNRGRKKHTVACTAPRCGFSADYDSRAAAELAARTHRCPVR